MVTGDDVVVTEGVSNGWTCVYTVAADDTDGPVGFTVSDITTTTGSNVAAQSYSVVDDTSAVTIDKAVPTLTTVALASNNAVDAALGTTGATVTLTIVASEAISLPTCAITVATVDATNAEVLDPASGTSTEWTCSVVLAADDGDGAVGFTISGAADLAAAAAAFTLVRRRARSRPAWA